MSAERGLTRFPSAWRKGPEGRRCRVSAFVRGTAGRKAAPRRGAPPPAPPGPSAKACTSTLQPTQDGGAIENALQSAPAGDVICLAAGNYATTGQIDLSNITPSTEVWLQPAPGATVALGTLNLTGTITNLTIQGFALQSVSARGPEQNVVFAYNQLSGVGSGFFFYAEPGNNQNNIQVLYNQMDHLVSSDPTAGGQCVTIDGGNGEEHNFTVSHNVCGPRIGNHYVQAGGIDGLAVDDNLFLGPADPSALAQQTHNNVLHIFGDSDNIDFSGNVIRNTDSRGQTVLIEEGHFDNITINNNLWQEDPMCLTNWNCYSYAIDVYNAHGLSFQNNTVVGSHWGVLLTDTESQSYSSGTNYTVAHNIVVGTSDSPDISYQNCVSSCTFDYNVTDDSSSNSDGSTHYVSHWKPRWVDTTWYQPVGLPFSSGYQH